jgi:uncharacterized protein YjbJ (UPF0337 family)
MFLGDAGIPAKAAFFAGTKTILRRFKEADRIQVSTFRTRCLFPRGRRVFRVNIHIRFCFQYVEYFNMGGTARDMNRLTSVNEHSRSFPMGSTSDKISGLANKAAGNIKQAAGKATGSTKLQAEGKAQELKGDAQQIKGKAKDAVKKVVDRA